MRMKQKLSFLAIQLTCMVITVSALCTPQEMYVRRGTYLSCRKIYNCRPGHEILPCENNCEKERCMPCEPGMVQPDLIHSHTEDRYRRCFMPDSTIKCDQNTVATQDGLQLKTCPLAKSCKCDMTKCFHGDYPCLCNRQFQVCGKNQTLSKDGKCVPCAAGRFKPFEGCEDCYVIDPYQNQTPDPKPVPKPSPTTHKPVVTPDPVPKPKPDPGSTSKNDTTSPSTTSTTTTIPLPPSSPVVVQPTTQRNKDHTSGTLHIIIIVVCVIVVIIIICAIVIVYLCKTNKFQGLKRRLRRHPRGRNPQDAHVRFHEGENLIPANGQCPPNGVLNNPPGRGGNRGGEIRAVQEETPESPTPGSIPCPTPGSPEDCYPLLPGYSPGVNHEQPSLYHLQLQMEAHRGPGKSSLESHSSGGSIPTPVPETGPSPGAHPLENIREYYRSISRDVPPDLMQLDQEAEVQAAHATYADIQVNHPHPPSTKDSAISYEAVNKNINVSSTTSAIPPSSSTSTSYPSPVVSDSMQTVGTEDHRVSALNCRDTNFDVQKVPEQSLQTASLSSDCADNTPDMCSLQPQQHDESASQYDESASHSESRLSTCPEEDEDRCSCDGDSISELKKKDSNNQDR